MKAQAKKILIISYYWPPSGGSGVQRWMYFAKYLKKLGWEPIVITVEESQASYPILDSSLLEEVKGIQVIKTKTREPLRWYSHLVSGNSRSGIPQGAVKTKSLFGKIAAYIRGNYFIPDARKGWRPYALKAAQQLIQNEKIDKVITTGPPHSSHWVGLQLKQQFKIRWWVDFRDPWTDIFYNASLYRTARTLANDQAQEKTVLQKADGVITTVGGKLHEQLKAKAPQQNFTALPNGYDADLMHATSGKPPKEVFHIVFTGLLTENQDYKTFLEVLNRFSESYKIRFSLAGNIDPHIIATIKNTSPNIEVQHLGYLSHQKAIALMKQAHLLLNFIFKGAQTQMISGKLLEYMATEVPILSIGNPQSEAGRFLMQGSAAEMIEAHQLKEIERLLERTIKGKGNLKNKFPGIENWSRQALTQRLEGIINEVY